MKKFGNMTVALGLMVILSACGSQTSRDQYTFDASNSITPNNNNGGGNTQNLQPAPTSHHLISGSLGSIPYTEASNIETSMKLKVKVTPGMAGQNTAIPSYSNPYGCFRLKVTAYIGNSVVTKVSQILRVDGTATNSPCANAPTSEIFDFTSYTTGNAEPITIRFSNAEYDSCYNSGSFTGYGCSMKPLYKTHTATFNAAIETDGTYME